MAFNKSMCDNCEKVVEYAASTNANKALNAHKASCLNKTRSITKTTKLLNDMDTTNMENDCGDDHEDYSSDNNQTTAATLECLNSMDPSKVSLVNMECYDFQTILDHAYKKLNTNLNIRNVGTNSTKASIKETLELYGLKINLYLSHEEMNSVLSCFSSILNRNNFKLTIPTDSNTLQYQCASDIIHFADSVTPSTLFIIKQYELKFPLPPSPKG